MFLPTINGHGDTPCYVYIASTPLDDVRIHCAISEDGTASPMLFVGGNLYPIDTKG